MLLARYKTINRQNCQIDLIAYVMLITITFLSFPGGAGGTGLRMALVSDPNVVAGARRSTTRYLHRRMMREGDWDQCVITQLVRILRGCMVKNW